MIYGLDARPLDEGCIALEAISVLQVLEADGEPTIEIRCTDGLKTWDAIGLLTVALDVARQQASACWIDEDDEDD